MLRRDEWLDLARKLDWELSYVSERDAFPEEVSGSPWLPGDAWRGWDEPFKTSYREYVITQHAKDRAVYAVRDALGHIEDASRLDRSWLDAVKLHTATLPLAEFAAVVGNLRAVRFARDSAWRSTALLGALDEFRHTQIPLLLMHELVRWNPQFNWTHKFLHSNNWVAVAARHMIDELLLTANPIELAIATNFVFETAFTNLQFVGLSSMAHGVGDRLFESMLQSIQTDEARHAQIGKAVIAIAVEHDRAEVQRLVDKWFWRTWLFFAVVTGFAMDYLTPLEHRTGSFRAFVEEWIVEQFQKNLDELGLARPWYWDQFLASIGNYHHMVYASAYTYRASVWFDLRVPGPDERAWLRAQYPETWDAFDPIWARVTERWQAGGPGIEWYVHGHTPIGFCRLCQLVLCGGTPAHNTAQVVLRDGERYIFCSEPCRRSFEAEPERYAGHRDIVQRILAGDAPGNVVALLTEYFGLTPADWGRDVNAGDYPWMQAATGAPPREPRS